VYAVIGCPRCSAVRVVREGQRTAGCPRCGYRIPLHKVRVFLRTPDPSQAVSALGELNQAMVARKAGEGPWIDLRVPVPRPNEVPSGPRKRAVVERARELASRAGPFTAEELAAEAAIPLKRAESLLDGLLLSGEVYSPAPGKFLFVGD